MRNPPPLTPSSCRPGVTRERIEMAKAALGNIKKSNNNLPKRDERTQNYPYSDLSNDLPQSDQEVAQVYDPPLQNYLNVLYPQVGSKGFQAFTRDREAELKVKEEQARNDYACKLVETDPAAIETVKGFFSDLKREVNQSENRILSLVNHESQIVSDNVCALGGQVTPSLRTDAAEKHRKQVERNCHDSLQKARSCLDEIYSIFQSKQSGKRC